MIPSATARAIEDAQRARRALTALDDSADWLLPDYRGRSLANVAATVALLLGGDASGMVAPLLPEYWRPLADGVRRVVLVLLDALGYLQLREMMTLRPGGLWERLAGQGMLLPMTSVYPSTTGTALATLMTGVEPISHGLLGYELWLREYGVLVQMLAVQPAYGVGKETLLDWGLVPEAFLPVPGLGALLSRSGITSTGYVPAVFSSGALSRMLYRGFTHLVGYGDVVDMCLKAGQRLRAERAERSFHWLYWGGIDGAIHQHGDQRAGGESWVAQYQVATQALEHALLDGLSRTERAGTLLIVCADHGFVDTPIAAAHDADADPALRRHLVVPPSGESRAAHLHCAAGGSAAERADIQASLGADYLVCATEALVAAGLFGHGPAAPESRPRLGQLHVCCRGQRYLDRRQLRLKLRGRHGGLSPAEMLVPWLAARLDA